MNLSELQNITAYTKNSPIIKPSQVDKSKLVWNKMDEEWLNSIRLNNQFWFTEYKFNPADFLPHQLPHVPGALKLRDYLLEFGGEQACMPVIDLDVPKLFERGQFWYGDISKMMKGLPSQCHCNSAKIWDSFRDSKSRNIKIATGYALTDDGMWRQHSWCVEVKPKKNVIIETTVKRIGYFGYVLTDEEAEDFLDNNF